MAAAVVSSAISEQKTVENGVLSIANNVNGVEMSSQNSFAEDWGFDLNNLYKLAVKFHREKDGKAMHLSYQDRLQLVALSQQVTMGKFDENLSPAVGYLDVIGKDRRQAWMTLGEMTKEKAMAEYVQLLDRVCVLFRPFVEAHKRDLEEKERRRQEEIQRVRDEEEERQRQLKEEEEARLLEERARLLTEQEKQRMESQKRHIQEALNQQTFFQFKAYAEQQCSGNPDQQRILIRQLQEQHYQQYMQQVYQQQLQQQQQNSVTYTNNEVNGEKVILHTGNKPPSESRESESSDDENSIETPAVAPASMWTRKDIREFKESIRREGGDSIIKVGHGETVTVRVPTHEDGTCLFWEFATDSYDIGFGVYFEWTQTPGTQVSVHISESEDEDEDEDEGKESADKGKIKVVFPHPPSRDDVEKGTLNGSDRAPVTVIIPIYRRDCHEEVYAGSHVYPGQGVYLLKFDNSYSLWRSKTLYYRVYYTH